MSITPVGNCTHAGPGPGPGMENGTGSGPGIGTGTGIGSSAESAIGTGTGTSTTLLHQERGLQGQLPPFSSGINEPLRLASLPPVTH